MFNYIKETIINDLSKVFVGAGDNALGVKRGGNYDLAKVEDLKIYKTKGVDGSVAVVTATVDTALTAGNIYRFSMFVKTPNKELSDYALANYAEFGKPIMVEFAGKGTAADDAHALENALKLALQPDNALYKVEFVAATTGEGAHGPQVKLTFANSWVAVAETAVEVLDTTKGEFVAEDNISVAVTANVEAFATAEWIVENLRFPSYPNVRYNALFADEAPIAGKKYNQYSFQYKVKKAVPGGLSAVGQEVDSITTHVFYVLSDLCADDLTTNNTFEKLIQTSTAGTSTIASGEHANEQVITLVVA